VGVDLVEVQEGQVSPYSLVAPPRIRRRDLPSMQLPHLPLPHLLAPLAAPPQGLGQGQRPLAVLPLSARPARKPKPPHRHRAHSERRRVQLLRLAVPRALQGLSHLLLLLPQQRVVSLDLAEVLVAQGPKDQTQRQRQLQRLLAKAHYQGLPLDLCQPAPHRKAGLPRLVLP
jgi:hypothetical protein